jgi:hypothetical protein
MLGGQEMADECGVLPSPDEVRSYDMSKPEKRETRAMCQSLGRCWRLCVVVDK